MSQVDTLIADPLRYRNIADYEFESGVSEAEARNHIQTAREIMAATRKCLVGSLEDEVAGTG